MLLRASLPVAFWWDALRTAVYIINRMPTKRYMTPFYESFLWSGSESEMTEDTYGGARIML